MERNLRVSLVFDEILCQFDFFQFHVHPKGALVKKRVRAHHQWLKEVPLTDKETFSAQFPEKPRPQSSHSSEESPSSSSESERSPPIEGAAATDEETPKSPPLPSPSPKTVREQALKETALSYAAQYPRAQVPRIIPSARFNIGHYETIGKRLTMVRSWSYLRNLHYGIDFCV